MPTPTYTPLATVTLGTAASSVTFSSIPATYRDLILVFVGVFSTAQNPTVRFNGDTTTSYSLVRMLNDGNTPISSANTENSLYVGNALTTTPAQIQVQLMDYSTTDKHKTALVNHSIGGTTTMRIADRWANTAAVTTISWSVATGTMNAGTTLNLYGVIA